MSSMTIRRVQVEESGSQKLLHRTVLFSKWYIWFWGIVPGIYYTITAWLEMVTGPTLAIVFLIIFAVTWLIAGISWTKGRDVGERMNEMSAIFFGAGLTNIVVYAMSSLIVFIIIRLIELFV